MTLWSFEAHVPTAGEAQSGCWQADSKQADVYFQSHPDKLKEIIDKTIAKAQDRDAVHISIDEPEPKQTFPLQQGILTSSSTSKAGCRKREQNRRNSRAQLCSLHRFAHRKRRTSRGREVEFSGILLFQSVLLSRDVCFARCTSRFGGYCLGSSWRCRQMCNLLVLTWTAGFLRSPTRALDFSRPLEAPAS